MYSITTIVKQLTFNTRRPCWFNPSVARITHGSHREPIKVVFPFPHIVTNVGNVLIDGNYVMIVVLQNKSVTAFFVWWCCTFCPYKNVMFTNLTRANLYFKLCVGYSSYSFES